MHPTPRNTRLKRTTPDSAIRRSAPSRLRAMFGVAVLGGILTAAGGCDKQVVHVPQPRKTSLAGKPTALFLLFGDRNDPRLLPVATVAGNHITPITLDSAGWRTFDHLYFQPGDSIPLYRDGMAIPAGTIRRGMWSDAEALYKLPGCRVLRPLGALTLLPDPDALASVELMASSAPLAAASARAATTPADLDSARAFAARAGQHAGLTKGARDELDLVVRAIQTGATDRPTLAISYSEKGGGGAHARHVFALGDIGVNGYATTYSFAARDSVPEFRRLIDHLDVTGDGVDEILLEGWKQGGESFLVMMQFAGGRWREVARGTSSWCADVKEP